MKPHSLAPSPAAIVRGSAAFLLALLVATVVDAQPKIEMVPPAVCALPRASIAVQDKKEPDKKEPDKKETPKPPEIKWPTELNGKDLAATLKDIEDPDPVIREFGARNVVGFGPPAAKVNVSKLLVKRMTAEKDPGVKAAVYAAVGMIQFDNEADNKEMLRLLVNAVDSPTGAHASALRLTAIQSIAQFGARGEGAIAALTGNALGDPAYTTRQAIANALGRVGFHETAGPNMRALSRLADNLAKDECAAVRMEALQALVLLGPPWAAPKKADDKLPPPLDTKSVDIIVRHMRARVGDPKTKLPAQEKDKQVEIWARLVLMRFDTKEINDENLDAIARYLTGSDSGVKVQALQALGLIGEGASRKLNDVLRLLEDKDTPYLVAVGAIQVLGAMGAGAKPALPNMQKFIEVKKKELAAKKIELAKKKDDLTLIGEVAALEALVKLLEGAIKHIDEAKPTSPMSDPKTDPKTPPKKP
jgi:HEAT repeat protein